MRIGKLRIHFMTTRYSLRKRSVLRWLPWWQSSNSGVRIVRASIPSQRARSVALYRYWKTGEWKAHCGFAWKA